jgi:hypothetical protein
MAANRNSFGFQNPDTINERAEAAAARSYGGSGMVKPSERVGLDVGHDIPPGILSMDSLAGNSLPAATRALVNTKPNKITAPLKAKLSELTAELAQRVNAVVRRKP